MREKKLQTLQFRLFLSLPTVLLMLFSFFLLPRVFDLSANAYCSPEPCSDSGDCPASGSCPRYKPFSCKACPRSPTPRSPTPTPLGDYTGDPCKICAGACNCNLSRYPGCDSRANECSTDADCGGCSPPPPPPPPPPTPTPTPTPRQDTCTGLRNCTTDKREADQCSQKNSQGQCLSYFTTTCNTSRGKEQCNSGWAVDTSCSSTSSQCGSGFTFGNCPADRAGCTWAPSNDCGGGTCGCGQRRVSTLWCNANTTHCDDACITDSACTVQCTLPTGGGGGGGGGGGPIAPASYGTLRARAAVVARSSSSCATVRSSVQGVVGTVHQFTSSSAMQPPPATQTGSSYVTWGNVDTGGYVLSSTPPADYQLVAACWENSDGRSGTGLSDTIEKDETLSFDLGYTLGSAWVQVVGGDVYASGTLKSYLPTGVTPRSFVLDTAGGYPGVVTYGTSYDFDADIWATGGSLVSSTDWLVKATRATTDYYELFYYRLGSPTTPDYDHPLTPLTKPSSRLRPYYVVGDVTTSGNWTIGNGETLIFLVDGNLTLGGRINLSGSGFAAFIVKGNLSVASSVGVPYTLATPVLEGIYVTSGTLSTGESTTAGAERLVGRGMFVAGSFLLQRDLASVGANPSTSAEYFIYHSQLLLSMPDSLKNLPYFWQEVAP